MALLFLPNKKEDSIFSSERYAKNIINCIRCKQSELDEEKKLITSSLIKEIEIFPCDDAESPLKTILYNFHVYKGVGDVCGFLWDKSTHVSTCILILSEIYYL
jgi:hypothetical protein